MVCARPHKGREQPRSLHHTVSARGPRRLGGFAPVFRGPQADGEQVRCQAALPETADELCGGAALAYVTSCLAPTPLRVKDRLQLAACSKCVVPTIER
jgi:hypothetical protein